MLSTKLVPPERVIQALNIASVLFWLPPTFLELLSLSGAPPWAILVFLTVNPPVLYATHYYATKPGSSSDILMIICFIAGFASEYFGVRSEIYNSLHLPRNWWLISSVIQGFVSGILCKAKDLADGRRRQLVSKSSLHGERLYLMVPFTVGLWNAHLLTGGLITGYLNMFKSIFFSLSLVGYGTMAYRLLSWSGAMERDLISMLNDLFMSSFGVVLMWILLLGVGGGYFGLTLAKQLIELNAVVSSVGILLELVVYDIA